MFVVVYHWLSGAYVNSYADDFDSLYAELRAQYGEPSLAVAEVR